MRPGKAWPQDHFYHYLDLNMREGCLVVPRICPEILRYQREVVDVLYAWAAAPKAIAAPTNLVPAEPITKPTAPADDASLDAWREYYQRMLALVEWQMDMEIWRGSVESRLEGVEAMRSNTQSPNPVANEDGLTFYPLPQPDVQPGV